MPRCVTGIPAAAGAAITDDTPGTTSKSIAGGGQRQRFLAATPEDERVAALQAHHPSTVEAELDEQRVDQLLRDRGAGALADVDQLRVRVSQGQHTGADERVVDHHLGVLQTSQPANRQQLGIAGAGADERRRNRVTTPP